ncbi:hypothetical protein [Enterocloster lavalensis]|uniref:hypothetical protein n=1 Tax=Enterocloster lavalensis TaxID=460384 RepID=UPI002A841902|nr:hypothetical protein [Enterocloster lavalensis]
MTAYEIISIFIGILALLMSFGSLIIAIIAFLDKRNKRKQSPAGCASGPLHSNKKPIPTQIPTNEVKSQQRGRRFRL